MPKLHPGFFTHLILKILGECHPLPPYRFPKTNTVGIPDHSRASTPSCTPILLLYHSPLTLSVPYPYNHFPNKAWLNFFKFLTAKPPSWIGTQICVLLTKWQLDSSPKTKALRLSLKLLNTVNYLSQNRKDRKEIRRQVENCYLN